MDTRASKDPLVLYDSRLVERNIRQGFIKRAEFDQFVTDLPDRGDRVDRVDFDEGLLAARVRPDDFKLKDSTEPDEHADD